jgi:intracellular septation protein A
MHAYLQREIFAVCVKLHDEIWDIFTFVFVLFFFIVAVVYYYPIIFSKMQKAFLFVCFGGTGV